MAPTLTVRSSKSLDLGDNKPRTVYTGTMPALKLRPTMPRPSDPTIRDAFANAIYEGHPVATAATIAGLSERTANEWRQLGGEEIDANADNEAWEPSSHAQFALAAKEAEARFVQENLGHVRAARQGDKGWLPAMTLLERRRPRDFGRQQYVDVQSTSLSITVTLPPGAVPALARTLGNAGLLAPVDADAEVTEPGS